ncbi:MAG: DUF2203 family protein [Acidobacteriota bacterium]
MGENSRKKLFTLEAARRILPEVRRLTAETFDRVWDCVGEEPISLENVELDEATETAVSDMIRRWAESVHEMGCEVKGLWTVDFDCGHGYYCWKHPERELDHYHSYEDGFAGRMKIV